MKLAQTKLSTPAPAIRSPTESARKMRPPDFPTPKVTLPRSRARRVAVRNYEDSVLVELTGINILLFKIRKTGSGLVVVTNQMADQHSGWIDAVRDLIGLSLSEDKKRGQADRCEHVFYSAPKHTQLSSGHKNLTLRYRVRRAFAF